MNSLEPISFSCPYCGEMIDTLADTSAGDQNYIEDCSVCCQPVNFYLRVDENEGSVSLRVSRDDE